MKNITREIINVIRKNRISSVEVSDALGKAGVVDGVAPLNKGHFIVGEVQYIYGHSESNWSIHQQAENLEEGGILLVDAFNCKNKALFGDIVTKYLLLYKRLDGLVVNGFLRDVHRLIKENYPIWCQGATPIGCYNQDIPLPEEIKKLAESKHLSLKDSILVCDDSGCTLIPNNKIDQDLLEKLNFIELQEDIWYFCIDTLKWSTYKTICQKDYLKEPEVLPESIRQRMKEFNW